MRLTTGSNSTHDAELAGHPGSMTLDVLLIAMGALGVLVAALSARIRRLPVSEPMLALVIGVLLGPEIFNLGAASTAHGRAWGRSSTTRPGYSW